MNRKLFTSPEGLKFLAKEEYDMSVQEVLDKYGDHFDNIHINFEGPMKKGITITIPDEYLVCEKK